MGLSASQHPNGQPSPAPSSHSPFPHTSTLRENASLPLQPRPPFNDRVTEGYLKEHEQG